MLSEFTDDPSALNCTDPANYDLPACDGENTPGWLIGGPVAAALFMTAVACYAWRIPLDKYLFRPMRHALYARLHSNASGASAVNEAEMSGAGLEGMAAPFLAADAKKAAQTGRPLMPTAQDEEARQPNLFR